MAIFWKWAIRNPMLLAAATCLLAGYGQVIDWSLAFTGAAVCGFMAEVSGHLASRASNRREPMTVRPTEEFADEATILKFRIAELEDDYEEELVA